MLDVIPLNKLDSFYLEIKKEALSCFVQTYKESMDFIKCYKDESLPLDEIEFECRKYIITEIGGKKCIMKKDYEAVILRVYKNLVCKILNKQVDMGVLELCWDKKECNFIWRKK